MQKYLFFILLIWGCRKAIESPESYPSVIISPSVNVKDYGAKGNGTSNDSAAFESALKAADSLHLPLYIPVGFYKTSILIRYDNIAIVGQQQPNEHLTDGAVIIGKINCNQKKNVSISNLGIDSRGQLQATDGGALVSGNNSDSITLHQQFNHITIIGDGYFGYSHGLLCQAGTDIVIKNIIVSNFYHGIAARSSNIIIDSIKAIDCGFTSVIVKSAESYNSHTYNVSINHITITGSSNNAYSRGGEVLIQSYEDISTTEGITVQNVNSSNGGISCVAVEQVKGKINNVLISNCTSVNQGDTNTRACYDVAGGSNITFENCSSDNALGFGYRCTGIINNIVVKNCYDKNIRAGSWI